VVGEGAHRDAAAEPGLQLVLEPPQELALRHAPALQLEQRVVTRALGRALQRVAQRLGRDPDVLLELREHSRDRRGQHADEVADDRLDRPRRRQLGHPIRRRMS
jgi:hypothetical protein